LASGANRAAAAPASRAAIAVAKASANGYAGGVGEAAGYAHAAMTTAAIVRRIPRAYQAWRRER